MLKKLKLIIKINKTFKVVNLQEYSWYRQTTNEEIFKMLNRPVLWKRYLAGEWMNQLNKAKHSQPMRIFESRQVAISIFVTMSADDLWNAPVWFALLLVWQQPRGARCICDVIHLVRNEQVIQVFSLYWNAWHIAKGGVLVPAKIFQTSCKL